MPGTVLSALYTFSLLTLPQLYKALSSPFFRKENRGIEEFTDLSKVIVMGKDEDRI